MAATVYIGTTYAIGLIRIARLAQDEDFACQSLRVWFFFPQSTITKSDKNASSTKTKAALLHPISTRINLQHLKLKAVCFTSLKRWLWFTFWWESESKAAIATL